MLRLPGYSPGADAEVAWRPRLTGCWSSSLWLRWCGGWADGPWGSSAELLAGGGNGTPAGSVATVAGATGGWIPGRPDTVHTPGVTVAVDGPRVGNAFAMLCCCLSFAGAADSMALICWAMPRKPACTLTVRF